MYNRNKDIYELYKSNYTLRDIAVKYGLSHEGVRRIINKAKSTPQSTTVNPEVINKAGLKQELDCMIASASLIQDKDIRLENLKTILAKVEYYKSHGFKLTGYSLRRIQAKLKTGKVERKVREENKPYRNRVLQSTEVRQNILMLACKFFFKAAGSGRKGRHGKRLSGNIKLTCDLLIKFAKENEATIPQKRAIIIKEIRRSGIKRKWLAKQMGITPVYLSYLLNKKRQPKNLGELLEKAYAILFDKYNLY